MVCCAPFDVEFGAAAFCVLEGDGHVFLRGGQGFAGHGCAAEVIALKEQIQTRVEEIWGVRLEPEPVMVGF